MLCASVLTADVLVVCSTKTCPTTRWTGWASRPPCTETRTAPGPCRRCTSTTGPSCTRTSTRTQPTPTPCLPAWAPPLTTLSREIKTLYTGRCGPPYRGKLARRPGPKAAGGLGGIAGVKTDKRGLGARPGQLRVPGKSFTGAHFVAQGPRKAALHGFVSTRLERFALRPVRARFCWVKED